MATITTKMPHQSGIPLGGLGTGTVEIRPDGCLHEWQIFNLGKWAPRQPEVCDATGPDVPTDALTFFVRSARRGAAPVVRRLSLDPAHHDLYHLSWLKSVNRIKFDGRFPVARLEYKDDGLPVEVSARFFSPFVPHDAQTSGTPGFYAAFTVSNPTDKSIDVSLLGTLKNPLAWCAADRKLTNRVTHSGDTTRLTMRTKARGACEATVGSLCLSVTGGEASWLAGGFDWFMRGRRIGRGPFRNIHLSLLHDFRTRGRLPGLEGDHSPAGLLRESEKEIAAMSLTRKKALARELRKFGFADCMWNAVNAAGKSLLKTKKGLTDFLLAARCALDFYTGEDRTGQTWGAGALCSSLTLAPHEKREVIFALGWFFPNHYSKKGPVLGHMYEHWFKNAEQVGRFLVKNYPRISRKVSAFANQLYDTTLDVKLADAWAGQLTTLAKCTWWTKAGDFAVWEGLGCCGFHTTDITYQGSFNILALFPELQKRQMEMGARFQRDDGRVHHLFTPDLSSVDRGFDRVDMNQQFVLLVCRDYLWTNDEAYLKRMWPHVVRAMDNTALLDRDGDGLLDHDTRRNTYDAWDFRGAPAYINSLWLSALLAATRIAQDLGKRARAAKWRNTLKKAARSFEKKLWNGEYYSLWVDGRARDECCMTDQVSGEWFSQLSGLGHVLPRKRILATLEAVMKHNFHKEDGLLNATYPRGAKRQVTTYRNMQAQSPWTGIEYAMASMLFEFGLYAKAQVVVNNVHERYLRAGAFWDHIECGHHYYRAMSSWALLLSATGFKIDVPRRIVTFAPPLQQPDLRAPWVSATGWGRFEQNSERFLLTCESGSLAFQNLRLSPGDVRQRITLNRRKLPANEREADGLIEFRLKSPVAMKEGDRLEAR